MNNRHHSMMNLHTLTTPEPPVVPGLTTNKGTVYYTSRYFDNLDVTGELPDEDTGGWRDKWVLLGTVAMVVLTVAFLAAPIWI